MPIEIYCRQHTVIPMLSTVAIGNTGGNEYTFTDQPAKQCHVRMVSGENADKQDVNSSSYNYRVRFDSDPGIDSRYMLRFGSIYLQVLYVKIVKDGSGTPVMWVAMCDQQEARQDP